MSKSYSDKLKHPKWQKARLKILGRDKFTCKKCGDKETTLHVHHIEYIAGHEPWDYDASNFITLCEHCHAEIELEKDNRPIGEIKIHKQIYQSGARIMYISFGGELILKLFEEDNTFLGGYIISPKGLKEVSKIINHTLKCKQ